MSSNEFNLMRIQALEGQAEKDRKRIQELETQLEIKKANETKGTISSPTRFKNINTWR
jgi:chaperonin cofactor prefoldin